MNDNTLSLTDWLQRAEILDQTPPELVPQLAELVYAFRAALAAAVRSVLSVMDFAASRALCKVVLAALKADCISLRAAEMAAVCFSTAALTQAFTAARAAARLSFIADVLVAAKATNAEDARTPADTTAIRVCFAFIIMGS